MVASIRSISARGVTIGQNAGPPPGPSFFGFSTGETNSPDDTPAVVTIQRTGDLTVAGSVNWSLTIGPGGNTRIQPATATGTASFPISTTQVQITVELTNMNGEAGATATMTLNTPVNGTLLTSSTDVIWGGGGG
jgi:hypothetical protein